MGAVNAMLGDEELSRLLSEAAESFAVPEPSFAPPAVVERKPVWRRPWPQAGAAAAVLIVAALVAGSVGGSGGFTPRTSVTGLGSAGDRASGADGGDVGAGTTGGTGGLSAEPPAVPNAYGEAPVAVPGTATPADPGARVVKTGELNLLVDDGKVSATVTRLQALVAAARGFVASSSSEESGDHPKASLTVRVPVSSYETVLGQVRALKVKVVSEVSTGKDVTASYADTQAQIQSLTAARSRYLSILAGAKTIAETLTVQQRVDEVQGQIDRLEGQRRVLADQSDFATLTVTVAEEDDGAELFSQPSGWSKAWDDAKDGFTSGVQSIIAGSGRTLLVLLVLVALAFLGRAGWRLARRRLV